MLGSDMFSNLGASVVLFFFVNLAFSLHLSLKPAKISNNRSIVAWFSLFCNYFIRFSVLIAFSLALLIGGTVNPMALMSFQYLPQNYYFF